jgi:hypothetical protein
MYEMYKPLFLLPLIMIFQPTKVNALDIRGQIDIEQRRYVHSDPEPQDQTLISIETDFYWQLNDDASLNLKPYFRKDTLASERDLFDLRELSYLHLLADYEIRFGIGEVFWGVTESQHLVDIINQTDIFSSIDGEDKLGQPMIHLTKPYDDMTLEAFVLPYFREQKLDGISGRLALDAPISPDARYESSAGEQHIDWAMRYSQSFAHWEVALSYFSGTSRKPLLLEERASLIPYYQQIRQAGLELQGVYGSWLLKNETVYRHTQTDNYLAYTVGFEYSHNGVASSVIDLGYLLEYSYDQRGNQSDSSYQNDIFIGTRVILNDTAGSEILIGIIKDIDFPSEYIMKLEASSRVTDNFRLRIDSWWFDVHRTTDPMIGLNNDDFIQLSLEYSF